MFLIHAYQGGVAQALELKLVCQHKVVRLEKLTCRFRKSIELFSFPSAVAVTSTLTGALVTVTFSALYDTCYVQLSYYQKCSTYTNILVYGVQNGVGGSVVYKLVYTRLATQSMSG